MGEINEISQCRRNESTSSNRGLAKAHFAGDVWKHHQRGDEAKLDSARKNILSATLNVIGEQVKSPWICAVVAVHLPTPSPPAARALGTLEKRKEGGRETRTSCATGVPARENPADPDGAAASPTKKPSASNKRDGRTERPARRGSEWRWAAPQLVDLEARSSLGRSRPAFGFGTIIVAIEAATAAAGRV